jgi:N-methylhydantoinase A/oxoprolinase/acetone carboxylase beta subunit
MGDGSAAARKGERKAYFPATGFLLTPVYDREMLLPDVAIRGPALLEEPESTAVVPPGFTMHMDDFGNVLIGSSSGDE